MYAKIKKIILLGFFTMFLLGFAQNRKKLEKQKRKTLKEIRLTKKLLKQTRLKKSKSLDALKIVNKLIDSRKKLLTTLSHEELIIKREIKESEEQLSELEKKLEKQKQLYIKSLRYTYRNNNSHQQVGFVFAAKSFNQAMGRMMYLKRFGEFQNDLLETIKKEKKAINENLIALKFKQENKINLQGKVKEEKEKLGEEKGVKEDIFKSLAGKEKELKTRLSKKRKAAKKLDKAIQRVIQKEIARARKRAAEKRRKARLNNKDKGIKTTPKSDKLSKQFSNNRFKLPWPVSKGIIVGRFGTHPHPRLADININNNGIDIRANTGELARCVFEGEVSAVMEIPGNGLAVLIKHGQYFTVYSNLSVVYVAKGQQIGLKEEIGKISTDEDGRVQLHFEIWNQQTKLNPESWLSR